jgi:endonuclease/exonuclease/phosphatase family metal-dependent hydrolase
MLDHKILSTVDLSKKHHITTRQIQKLAKKAIESGDFNILLESKEYRVLKCHYLSRQLFESLSSNL